jgi:hypothetical protein
MITPSHFTILPSIALLRPVFGQDVAVAIRAYRSIALWMLGYPVAALGDAERALEDAREIGHAATLMYALSITFFTQVLCGRYAAAKTQCDEVSVLAEEKGALIWKAAGTINLGCVLALTSKPFEAVRVITVGLAAERSIGGTAYRPWWLANCSMAYAALGDFETAWSSIDEAMTAVEAVKEKWFEADIHRTAGEIARMQADPDPAKAEAYSSKRSRLRAHRRRNPGNCAPRPAWRDCGASRASGMRPMPCSRPSTAGSPKALTHST